MTTILNGEGPISISQSESVTLSCKSDGVPEPIISWLRNGVVVKSGDIESSSLVITSASESHTRRVLAEMMLEFTVIQLYCK